MKGRKGEVSDTDEGNGEGGRERERKRSDRLGKRDIEVLWEG